jgi:hypothetical protein
VTGGKAGEPVVIEGFEVRAEPDFNYEVYGEMALSVGIEIDGGYVVLSKNKIQGNAAADYAGYSGARSTAVQITNGEWVRLCDNDLSGGFAEGLFGSETIGVTILGEGVAVEMQRNTISSGLGGAVSPYVTAAVLHGVFADTGTGPLTLIQNDIRTPRHWEPAKLAEAFAVMSWADSELLAVANFLLADNALDSRALVAYGPTRLIQNTVVSIGQWSTHAAALYDQSVLVDDILRSGNGSAAAVIRLEAGSVPLQIVHCDLDSAAANASLIRGADVQVNDLAALNDCTWEGCEATYGNLSADPRFAGADDLHLKAGSPCVNAGIDPSPWYAGPEIHFDFDGNSRPAGAGWEIGADERPAQ